MCYERLDIDFITTKKVSAEEVEEHIVEYLLDEALHSTGNGELYGSEIGDGAGITFCLVIDVAIALETIRKELSKHNVIEGAEIAFLNDEGTYIFLYPEGADFELG